MLPLHSYAFYITLEGRAGDCKAIKQSPALLQIYHSGALMQTNKNYAEKLKSIRPFTRLRIKNRINFTPSQKRLITIYYNELTENGLIENIGGKYIQKSKYIRNQKKPFKGAYNKKGHPRIKGNFYQGALPQDKLDKRGRILKGAYIKEFIPIDFTGFAVEGTKEFIKNKLEIALEGHVLKESDYFSMVLIGGWEIGQNMKHKTRINQRRNGPKIKISKGKEIRNNKIRELTNFIFEALSTSMKKYEVKENLLIGIYLYKFKNQRKPSNKELQAIK